MFFRRLAAVAAVSLLLFGLASCRSDPSVAAYVGGKQITVDQIDSYYVKAAKDTLSSQVVSQQPNQIKPALVSMLLYIALLKDAADQNHVPVTAGQLARAKEVVAPQRSSLTSSDPRILLPLDDLAQLQTYQALLSSWARTGTSSETVAGQKYLAALKASMAANPVTVNPRFGKFDLNHVPRMLSADVAVTPAPSSATS